MAATSASSFSGVPSLARSLRRHLFPYAAPLLSLSVLAPSTPSLYSSRGFCHVAVCAKPSSEPLVRGIADKTLAETVKNILEKARRASSRREVLHSGFVTPPVVKETMLAIEKLTDVKAIAQGGYPQAERCRISVGHPGSMITDPDVIAALSISGNFKFEPCSHGDFLGAILGVGIKRDAVGDILMQGEKGAQVLVIPDMVDLLTSTLDKVGNVGVSCTQIPLLALEYEPPRTKSFKTVEPSLRVDALASAGFKLSRTKLVNLISNGDVRVNWSTVRKNGVALKTGDVVSVSGMGRLKIGEISTTRKGKYAVELIRYF
ncbi:RNA-binding S4 domain-containing protein [Rhynchospora pubera]|uniref:RNA-binding S4 domain-containing protein n=1 Tax=Rhynchospora pubera TaxID=906938 RepID=A0AAV8DQ51_9POAL|nr:RNA-binding S4 domain-containing protein [Rhynchospora pubera]KAJ4821199.1 RNA-binding S4 domain-containing protein [Rhynchospora pubera]